MMIVRIKTVANTDTQEKVRKRIKEQIAEGLIVHDDTIEIMFVDDICPNCFGTNLKEINAYANNGVVVESTTICEYCGFVTKGITS